MRILTLDDMEIRQVVFRTRFSGHVHDEAKDAESAIDLLENFDYDLVMLDHDLAEEHYLTLSQGLSEKAVHPPTCPWNKDWHACTCGAFDYKPGTGMDVVDHIIKMPVERRPKTAVVHSWNPRGQEMARRLEEVGVRTYRIPFQTSMYIPGIALG